MIELAEAVGLVEIVDVAKVVAMTEAAEIAVVVGMRVETGLTEVELEIYECAVALVKTLKAELVDAGWLVGDETAGTSDGSK